MERTLNLITTRADLLTTYADLITTHADQMATENLIQVVIAAPRIGADQHGATKPDHHTC